MKVLVTGGAGFIGSAVCRHLVAARGQEVVNVDALTYAGNPRSLDDIRDHPAYRFVHADIRDADGLAGLFAETQPDAVIHLAAESHVDRSIDGPAAFIDTNVTGTFTLLEAALAYWQQLDRDRRARFRFLHVSTDEVYGSLGPTGLFTETTPYRPSSPYSASKAASDHLVNAWAQTYGLPTLITNSSNNYGPRQLPEKLIPLCLINALEGRDLPVYGSGENVRDWLYVDDHARALWTVLTAGTPGEVYNVGGRAERTNISVVRRICDLVDEFRPAAHPRRDLIRFVEDRPGHDARYAMDIDKISKNLGWAPAEDFDSGLRKTVAWYLENPGWWREVRAQRYGGERLGLDTARDRT